MIRYTAVALVPGVDVELLQLAGNDDASFLHQQFGAAALYRCAGATSEDEGVLGFRVCRYRLSQVKP